MKHDGISVLVPVYNEEQSIAPTLNQINRAMSNVPLKYEIIVINDGSTDKSKEILEKQEGIHLINNEYNLGYGASLKKGIAISKYPLIFMVDADRTYPFKDMPRLIKYANKYDMVVGARTGKSVHIPIFRRPAKWFISTLVNFLCERKVKDVNSGFRVFKKEIATRFIRLFPPGFSFTTTLTLIAFSNDYTTKYVPIDYYERVGKSSISPFKDFAAFIFLIFRVMVYFNPLKFFLIPGVFIIIIGIFYGVYQTMTTSLGVGQLPIILTIAGLQICFLGIIADLVNKKTG